MRIQTSTKITPQIHALALSLRGHHLLSILLADELFKLACSCLTRVSSVLNLLNFLLISSQSTSEGFTLVKSGKPFFLANSTK